jgi:periplasmic divalent cation tolerance protein
MAKYVTVYITTSISEEAKKIAHEALDKKLIACANIIPNVTSIYKWQGETREDAEVSMLLKTTIDKVKVLKGVIKRLHSASTPCIVVLPIKTGDRKFLDWIAESVK